MKQVPKLLNDDEPAALFLDLNKFVSNLMSVKRGFGTLPQKEGAAPARFLHTMAVKANPLSRTLLIAKSLGFGAEVASPCELEHALRLGFPPADIMFDSPAKTMSDLRRAMTLGARINADSFQELDRIALIHKEMTDAGETCESVIGVRINPQLGAGTIAATGTVAKTSKFGIPLEEENRNRLLKIFASNKWLTSVHCHVGSQGVSPELLLGGAGSILSLAEAVNKQAGFSQVTSLDIGGGMSVDYDADTSTEAHPKSDSSRMEGYAATL
jgi:diaminopimelate decarboxylase